MVNMIASRRAETHLQAPTYDPSSIASELPQTGHLILGAY